MSEHANTRNKKLRRAIIASVSVLAVLAAGGIVFSIVERIRDAADRAT
jgi:hypothetical protein